MIIPRLLENPTPSLLGSSCSGNVRAKVSPGVRLGLETRVGLMTRLTNSWSRLLATSHLKIDLGGVAHWRRANTQPPTKQKLRILRRKKGPISNLGRDKSLGSIHPS